MSIYDIPIARLDGTPASLADHKGSVILAVNVASKCGFTYQYDALQALQETYAGKNFTVAGFPCNQFLAQESGEAGEIAEFCRMNFGVTFPLFEKIDVNGTDEHPLFTELKAAKDSEGVAGDIKWNFEKILIDAQGVPTRRFRTMVEPNDAHVISAINDLLT